jgi:hypothetical protein
VDSPDCLESGLWICSMAYKILLKRDESVTESWSDYSLFLFTKCEPHASKSRRVKYYRNKNLVHHNLKPESVFVECDESCPERCFSTETALLYCHSVWLWHHEREKGSVSPADQVTNMGTTMYLNMVMSILWRSVP